LEKNLAILLTPPGTAAIAVVRLVGAGVQEFLAAHFSRPVVPGRPIHGNLIDAGRVVDDPVVVAAEDFSWADISLHGGTWVVREMLELARSRGYEIARTGDLPLDAFDGDLIEREMMVALPAAKTELALRWLLAQPSAWRRRRVIDARKTLDDPSLWRMLNPPRVAIVGAPNAGKSTLANQLFGQERSITADMPGTTRDWVGEIANLDGLAVMLVDTPGLRQTDDAIEQTAIERSQVQVQNAELVVLVLDASRTGDADQTELARRFPHALVVLNKCDLKSAKQSADVYTVATTGRGIDLLRQRICAKLIRPWRSQNYPRWWTRRQRESLEDQVKNHPLPSQRAMS